MIQLCIQSQQLLKREQLYNHSTHEIGFALQNMVCNNCWNISKHKHVVKIPPFFGIYHKHQLEDTVSVLRKNSMDLCTTEEKTQEWHVGLFPDAPP
jgi:hypothetical protein